MNHGDAGLVRLFEGCFRLLEDDGVLLVEPQPWKSYRRRRNLLSPEVQATLDGLELRPDSFANVTLPAAGFEHVRNLGCPPGLSPGFSRSSP
ncbi:Bicoid-interacting 3 [Baffinella frigidus]|nr:Bicoid-interacting 3 [Cryptophyta sp. CCMP2293]